MYCSSHVPKSGPGHLDQTSVGIRQALDVPKTNKYVNEQIRGTREVEGMYTLYLSNCILVYALVPIALIIVFSIKALDKPRRMAIIHRAKSNHHRKWMVTTSMDGLMPVPFILPTHWSKRKYKRRTRNGARNPSTITWWVQSIYGVIWWSDATNATFN